MSSIWCTDLKVHGSIATAATNLKVKIYDYQQSEDGSTATSETSRMLNVPQGTETVHKYWHNCDSSVLAGTSRIVLNLLERSAIKDLRKRPTCRE